MKKTCAVVKHAVKYGDPDETAPTWPLCPRVAVLGEVSRTQGQARVTTKLPATRRGRSPVCWIPQHFTVGANCYTSPIERHEMGDDGGGTTASSQRHAGYAIGSNGTSPENAGNRGRIGEVR